MNERPTPETDAAIHKSKKQPYRDFRARELHDFARKLERERDEARTQADNLVQELEKSKAYANRCKQGCISLSFAIDRIDYACGEPNEMECSDYCIHQNEKHVVKRVNEKLSAMREALKEAHQAIKAVPIEYDPRFFRAGKWSEEALAKLDPFLTDKT